MTNLAGVRPREDSCSHNPLGPAYLGHHSPHPLCVPHGLQLVPYYYLNRYTAPPDFQFSLPSYFLLASDFFLKFSLEGNRFADLPKKCINNLLVISGSYDTEDPCQEMYLVSIDRGEVILVVGDWKCGIWGQAGGSLPDSSLFPDFGQMGPLVRHLQNGDYLSSKIAIRLN